MAVETGFSVPNDRPKRHPNILYVFILAEATMGEEKICQRLFT